MDLNNKHFLAADRTHSLLKGNSLSSLRKSIFIYLILCISTLLTSCVINQESVNNNTSESLDTTKDFNFTEPEITGRTFYVDPVNGSADGDGSQNNPWRTLQEIFENNLIQDFQHTETSNPSSPLIPANENAPIKGGDRIYLLSGYHGYLSVSRLILKEWLTIEAYPGETPVLSRILFTGGFEKIYLKNITIEKSSYEGPENYWEANVINRNSNACIYLGTNTFHGLGRNIKLNGLTIRTLKDSSNWTAADWVEKAAGGISLRSVPNVEIVNCTLSNVSSGITIDHNSDFTKAWNNTITGYSGDGARVCSNNCYFAYNTIADSKKVNENHDDGIQSYSRGSDNSPGSGVLKNNVIRGNLIIGSYDPYGPLAGNPQGIGCFDGMFENWVVENNIIITNTYHGISFLGMVNSKILNNTVLDSVPGDTLSPWIRVAPHKNGTPSRNTVVANNIAAAAVIIEGTEVHEYNNYIFGKDNNADYDLVFTDFTNFDLNLKRNDTTLQNIIDRGTHFKTNLSSSIDLKKNTRDKNPDIGALEWQ